jgi:hypothetical protein
MDEGSASACSAASGGFGRVWFGAQPGQLGKRNYPDDYRIELIDRSGR